MSVDDRQPSSSPEQTADVNEAFRGSRANQKKVFARWGRRRVADAGDVLFAAGDAVADVSMVNTGRMALLERSLHGERAVRVRVELQQLGELGMNARGRELEVAGIV